MIRAALLVLLTLVATSGCGVLTGRPLAAWAQDQGMQARVKTRLAREDPSTLTRIHVDTYERIVYLTGGAISSEMKRRAEEIARGVPGVEQVVNNIHLVGEGVLAAAETDVSASPAMNAPLREGSRRDVTHPLLRRFTKFARFDLETGIPGWTRYVAWDAAGRRVATIYSFPSGELSRGGAATELTGAEEINHVAIYRHAIPGASQYDVVLWHVTREEAGRLE